MDKKEIFKNKKLLIGIIIIVLVVVAAVIAIMLLSNNDKSQKTEKQNKFAITAEDVIKDEKYGNLDFTNTTLIKEGSLYTLSMDITNKTKEDVDLEQVNIKLTDKKGNELITLLGYIGDPMKAGETRTMTSSTSVDLSKANAKTIVQVIEK